MALDHLTVLFDKLRASSFRSRFKLGPTERAYLEEKGMTTILNHGADFIAKRLAPAHPANDGKQTPWRGHPIFLAQHATGTCCRTCLAKWHAIPKGAPLDDKQRDYILSVFRLWLEKQIKNGEKIIEKEASQISFEF